MMTEALINAELTIGSLLVLGFNANDYIENYPGIAYGVTNLTPFTFDKQNEKSLMITLHFLLMRLDPLDFAIAIESCFPYLDVKTKNDYKRAIQASFERLVQKGWLKPSVCKMSILAAAKGTEVWTMLRVLSDICVEMTIADMTGQDYLGDSSTYSNMETIRESIDFELQELEKLIMSGINTQKEHSSYFNELDVRLRRATKSVEASRKKLQQIIVNDVPLQILTESGRLQRSEWIAKITKSKQLLLTLSQSPLLVKANELLNADKEQMLNGQLPVQQKRKHSHLTPEQWKDFISKAADKMQLQRLQPGGITAQAGDDFAAIQRTILGAVNGLIAEIDQIPVV